MNVVIASDFQGILYHRMVVPFGRIAQQGLAEVHIIQDVMDLISMDLSKVDRVIVSRFFQLTPEGYESLMPILKENDVKIIVDIDDHWVLPEDNTARDVFEKGGIRTAIINAIKHADHLWTPNELIHQKARLINPDITHTIIPNAINPTEGQFSMIKNFNSDASVRFGYTGAKNHTNDLKLMGVDWSKHYTYTTDIQDYHKLLEADEWTEPLPLHEYGTLYQNFNVSLAPLRNRVFDKCKSNLKAIEAGFTGCAFIGSNTTPYKEIIINGENGILCSSPEEWNEAVNSITPKDVKRLAQNLYETVREEYHIDNVIKLRANELQ
tara:strand:- start:7259 stop:8227 length:969 start_codon:yes stop_codon:yes gene_type:complete